MSAMDELMEAIEKAEEDARWAIAERTRLRAENAALKAKLAAEEWRPIEEAPKDEWLLLWQPGWGMQEIGKWNMLYKAWASGTYIWRITPPTHYRPLPQPPEVM